MIFNEIVDAFISCQLVCVFFGLFVYEIRVIDLFVGDMEKNSHLKRLQALGHLEVLRADLGVEGSFDEAVAGCHYAFLVAAPVNLTSEDPEVNTCRG